MAAPNIAALTLITGKTDVLVVTASASAIVTNSAASGKVYKVNALLVSNITTAAKWVTVDIYRTSVAYRIVYQIPVPVGSTFTVIDKEAPIYLEEGDSIRVTGEATSSLEAVASYEVLSDA
jgi:hypothetical protein